MLEVPPQQVTPSTSSQSSAAMSYPDNSEGLRLLLDNMLFAAKKDDRPLLQSMIRETEIPNYETWFTTTFGQKAGGWAEPYGERLTENEKTFEELIVQLAHTDGAFAVVKAGTLRKYDLSNNPLGGYRADWMPQATNGADVVHIADFFFIEGRFRWDSTVSYVPFQKLKADAATNHGALPRCSYMPFPAYTEKAKAAKISGSVLVEGIVGPDGRITNMRIVRGLGYGLDESAMKTMKQWKCEPAIGPNGKPVPAKVPFEINFRFY